MHKAKGNHEFLYIGFFMFKMLIREIHTSLLGTHIGVPFFTNPASIETPITIGSRELNIQFGRILSLHGNTAICLNSSCFRLFKSSLNLVNLSCR